jgi:hypothetical protein
MPPEMAMLQMTSGYWISQSIYAAAKLGIPDLLKSGPKIARSLLLQLERKHALFTVSCALAQVGVFAEKQEGSFSLTPFHLSPK